MGKKKRWQLIRWVWGQHKWFEDLETGRIGVCDDSGDHPEEADDGILWLAQNQPITLHIHDEGKRDSYGTPEEYTDGFANIPLEEPDGEGGSQLVSGGIRPGADEWLWVAGEFGMPIEVVYESGRPSYRFYVTSERMPARNPRKPLASADGVAEDNEEAT